MSKFGIMLKKLYVQKLKSKTFIISTSLYIVGILVFAFWSDIKELFTGDGAAAEVVAIYNGTAADVSALFTDDGTYSYTFVDEASEMEVGLEAGDYFAALELADVKGKLAANIYSTEALGLNDQEDLASTITAASQLYAVGQLNLTPEQSALVLDSTPIIEMIVTNARAEDGKSADEKMAGILGSYAAGVIIYITVISFLSIITTDVASEKGSRALEMLLVSVKPETHFQSKVFGIFLVALTQFAMIGAVLVGVLKFTGQGAKWDMAMQLLSELSVSYYLYVGAFLIFTIFLFLIMGALFGSLVSKVEESSQVMMPSMIVIIIAFYVMISGMSNPDTLLIKVFSYIPFTAGMVMPMRIGGTDMGMMEPLIALIILIVTVVIMYKISIIFYKRSVLTYSTGGVIQKIKTVFKVTT